ncbi:hypothetical protein CKO38_11110 [Rhodospirillum rubrum]|uniref:hypothetical protein n=1 Tax=Rhodospirillum rubrum TaxID=1085 RepID=UPI001905A99D|nr:hypothetical protein [Rhodospirillum rubrum]MBK1665005.1 hypothetical protein [Rhodospirillum rubrum]MBK1677202.1 hypothetical protein [Rhodospirillum rubrum]
MTERKLNPPTDDHKPLTERPSQRPEPGQGPGHTIDPNIPGMLRLAVFLGFALIVARTMPDGLLPHALASLLNFAALASCLVASLRHEPIWQDHLTRWDEAAVLMAVSLLAGAFADPQVLEGYRQTAGLGS